MTVAVAPSGAAFPRTAHRPRSSHQSPRTGLGSTSTSQHGRPHRVTHNAVTDNGTESVDAGRNLRLALSNLDKQLNIWVARSAALVNLQEPASAHRRIPSAEHLD